MRTIDSTPEFVASVYAKMSERLSVARKRLNRPLTLTNYPAGAHAFDLLDDSETSRRIIRQVLDFLRDQLTRAGS
jgi:acetyl esterase/lipase